jgi:hypothetical protein
MELMDVYASLARAICDVVMAFVSDGTSTARFKLLAFGRDNPNTGPSPHDACTRT